MKKLFLVLSAGVMALALAALPAASSEAISCDITWGSLAKTSGPAYSQDPLTNIRTGEHTCYDRMVLDFDGSASGYDVRYVDNVYLQGSGDLLPLNGDAKLQIIAKAPAHDTNYNPTYPGTVGNSLPGVDLTGYQTFRDAKFGGTFEGQTQVGLGVRARLPFRVLQLDNRVVVDVAHYW